MSADGDTVRAALEYAKRTLDQIWHEGGTNQGIHVDPALAALARLEAAEEYGQRWRRYHDAMTVRAEKTEAQRDALAEALRTVIWLLTDDGRIARGNHPKVAAVEHARAVLAQAGLE